MLYIRPSLILLIDLVSENRGQPTRGKPTKTANYGGQTNNSPINRTNRPRENAKRHTYVWLPKFQVPPITGTSRKSTDIISKWLQNGFKMAFRGRVIAFVTDLAAISNLPTVQKEDVFSNPNVFCQVQV
jgi:hypothetical protein